MHLYDPARRRTGHLPALLSRPDWVVPQLAIWPEVPTDFGPEGTRCMVRVSTTIPAGGAESAFVARQISALTTAEALPDIIADYRADPEQFLETFFNIKLEANPKRKTPTTHVVVSSADLGI